MARLIAHSLCRVLELALGFAAVGAAALLGRWLFV